MGVLHVVLEKCTDLKDTDGALNNPDPYVSFHLEKDNIGPFDKDFGKQQSTTKKCTCTPVYNEKFTFNGIPSLDNLVLEAKIWDEDYGLDDHMGHVKINLEKTLTPGEEKEYVELIKGSGKLNLFSKKARMYMKIIYEP